MFSTFAEWVDSLLKAAGHKYIKRVPYQSQGKMRYRYIYHVTHTAGGKHVLDPEHMVQGAAFMLGATKGAEVHAHITKVDGDKVTYRLDDGPEKGKVVTESKSKLAQRLNETHGVHEALAGAREKQAKVVADLKARGASEKQIAREQARLERLSVSTPAPEPKSEEPKKRAPKKPAGSFTFEVEGMNAKGLKAMLEDAISSGSQANKERASKLMESIEIKGDKVMIPESPAERNATLQEVYSLIMAHSVGKDSDVLSRFGAVKNKRAIEALARTLSQKPKGEEPKSEEPKSEEPKSEEPKSEEPKPEEPKPEEPKPEEPKSEAFDTGHFERLASVARDALRSEKMQNVQAALERAYMGPLSGAAGMGKEIRDMAARDAEEFVERYQARKGSGRATVAEELVRKMPETVADIVSNTLIHMGQVAHVPEFRHKEAVSLGRDPSASSGIKHALDKASSLPDVLADFDMKDMQGTRDRLSARAVTQFASEVMSNALKQARTELEKQAAQHRRAIEHTKGASKALEQYARYAVDTGAVGKGSAAARYVGESDLRDKGEPALVKLLTESAAQIERTLSDESAFKRAVFETIQAKSRANRNPRFSAMNVNIDNVLEAMSKLV